MGDTVKNEWVTKVLGYVFKVEPVALDEEPQAIDQDEAREGVGEIDERSEDGVIIASTAKLLQGLVTNMKLTKGLVLVDSVDALAGEMGKENGISKQEARQMIDSNQGRGFTGKSGTLYVIGTAPEADHDVVHETVHLLSAPGGGTKIMAKYGEQLNEGCTEFFTKKMCAQMKVKDAAAYPAHVAFMNKLVGVVGLGMLHTAYMKDGGFDPVLAKLADIWISKDSTLPGPQKPPKVKGSIARDKAVESLDKRFQSGFPPEGPGMKFWDIVFFN